MTSVASTTVATPSDLLPLVGRRLGMSGWREVAQEDVDAFARATGDEQWIHVDVERAAVGPFGGTIAHGYMTLALVAPLLAQLLSVERTGMIVNYGVNRVRFPAPVFVGSRVRMSAAVVAAERFAGGTQVVLSLTIQSEGAPRPSCVAEVVGRYYD